MQSGRASELVLTPAFSLLCTVLCLLALSCPTLCDPMDCSLPGSSVYGILQARILKWVAMPSSRGSSQPRDWNPGLPHYRWILYSALIKLSNAHPNLLNSIYESKCQSLLEIPPQTHPEIIFNQISGHPLVQSSRHRTLTITHRYICIIYFLFK